MLLPETETDPEVVKSTNQYVTIENLRKYTNYTVWVLAYTKVGDGMKTKPFYCRTHEDGKWQRFNERKRGTANSPHSLFLPIPPPPHIPFSTRCCKLRVATVIVSVVIVVSGVASFAISCSAFYLFQSFSFHCNCFYLYVCCSISLSSLLVVSLSLLLLLRIFVSFVVPSAPQAIKAIPASSTKIIISWLPPDLPNGDIVSTSGPARIGRTQCVN